ncbi:hypothetical protein A5722_12030 [Mycobacterium vulneris]|nr:hypothetical protein A5722_12030 [Mycolicibacterium vulneris]OCB62016.1 hypothetical protein A5729_27900 [Mycolicibacterium vulneris]
MPVEPQFAQCGQFTQGRCREFDVGAKNRELVDVVQGLNAIERLQWMEVAGKALQVGEMAQKP